MLATLSHGMGNETVPEYVIITIGVSYLITSLVIIPLHVISSYLIWKDKTMRSPTYQIMINLSVADVLELIAIAFFSGITILSREEPNIHINRFMSFLTLVGW